VFRVVTARDRTRPWANHGIRREPGRPAAGGVRSRVGVERRKERRELFVHDFHRAVDLRTMLRMMDRLKAVHAADA